MGTETAIRERPILFSGEMVLAILRGETQTRRICKHKPACCTLPSHALRGPGDWTGHGEWSDEERDYWVSTFCPYGKVGEPLWVREAWKTAAELDAHNATGIAEQCLNASYRHPWAPTEYLADGVRKNWDKTCWGEPGRYRHARFMPRWASRITLELTDVRVQRLQEISEADAEAEGVDAMPSAPAALTHRTSYARLWDKINGRGSWDTNHWVWALTFRRVPNAH